MATATVTPLVRSTPKAARAMVKRRKGITIHPVVKQAAKASPGAALGLVIGVLLCLSLGHLARGIALLTHWGESEALSMAIGLDLLIVCLEVAEVYTSAFAPRNHKAVATWAHPALMIAFTWSAGLNALASCDLTDLLPVIVVKVVAALLGLFIPVLIYLATRAWAALAIPAKATKPAGKKKS